MARLILWSETKAHIRHVPPDEAHEACASMIFRRFVIRCHNNLCLASIVKVGQSSRIKPFKVKGLKL